MKKIFLLVLSFMLFLAIDSLAMEGEEVTYDVATEISHIKYEEPGIMEEEGIMYGLSGSMTYRKDRNMWRFEGRFSLGQVDYTSQTSGELENIDDYMIETRILGGRDFFLPKAWSLTPYFGFGYRYLNDDSWGKITTVGHRGYERESRYFYSPIGVEALRALKNGWDLGLTLEYDHFWHGIQKSHISQANASFSDLENDQEEGFGTRAAIGLTKKSEDVDFTIETFIRHWDIAESERATLLYTDVAVGYGFEPANNSTEYGLKLKVAF